MALTFRRTRAPLILVVGFVSALTYLALDYPKGPIFIGVALAYVNAVVLGWRRLALSVLVVGYVVAAWLLPLRGDDPWPDWTLALVLGAWLAVLASASELLRTRLERAGERQAARAEEARRRASEERLRIARELHDVLAHNISLINVRAGVALHLVDERPDAIDPDQVRPALAAIKDASKDALGELRSVLDLLRQDEAAPLAPTAGLADLDGLADRARGTGLDVVVERLNGDGRAVTAADITDGLPTGVDLAAFRIAQEALTNVVRHAGATRATVRLRRAATGSRSRWTTTASAPAGPHPASSTPRSARAGAASPGCANEPTRSAGPPRPGPGPAGGSGCGRRSRWPGPARGGDT